MDPFSCIEQDAFIVIVHKAGNLVSDTHAVGKSKAWVQIAGSAMFAALLEQVLV